MKGRERRTETSRRGGRGWRTEGTVWGGLQEDQVAAGHCTENDDVCFRTGPQGLG